MARPNDFFFVPSNIPAYKVTVMPSKPLIALCMEYPVAQAGGVEVLVVELLRGLASDFGVVLVSDDDADSLAASGLAPLIDKHFPWRFGHGGAAEAKRLAADLKRADVALAHFHFGGTYTWHSRCAHRCPIPMTARLGIPVVITNHLVVPPMEGFCGAHRPLWLKLGVFPFFWLNRLRVLNAAKREFAVSLADRYVLASLFWPLRGRISHMYHSKLDENESGGGSTADERAPIILTLGTIGWRKGQRILVEAFDRIARDYPDWTLRIVGRPGEKDYYEGVLASDAARRLGPRLQITGMLPDAAIPGEMYQASIFVMPSLREGLGLSLQEAMFRGCACLGTTVGGIPDLIEHDRTGWLVPPDNPAALAEGLRRLITQPALRRQLADRGRVSIIEKGMTRQQMVRRHAELYRSILNHEVSTNTP
jgi:glycosyltransferase involved in cell wall biosynthesis